MRKPLIVADNEPTEPEPEGFWEPVHEQVRKMRGKVPSSSDFVLDDDD